MCKIHKIRQICQKYLRCKLLPSTSTVNKWNVDVFTDDNWNFSFLTILGEAVADILAPGAEDDAEEDERDDEQCDHEWKADQCKICSLCGLCTGYGDACVNTYQPGRNPGM